MSARRLQTLAALSKSGEKPNVAGFAIPSMLRPIWLHNLLRQIGAPDDEEPPSLPAGANDIIHCWRCSKRDRRPWRRRSRSLRSAVERRLYDGPWSERVQRPCGSMAVLHSGATLLIRINNSGGESSSFTLRLYALRADRRI